MYKTSRLENKVNVAEGYKGVLKGIESSYTNVDKAGGLEYNIDGCSCMSCGCFKNLFALCLSPVGIAAGTAAFGVAAMAEVGSTF